MPPDEDMTMLALHTLTRPYLIKLQCMPSIMHLSLCILLPPWHALRASDRSQKYSSPKPIVTVTTPRAVYTKILPCSVLEFADLVFFSQNTRCLKV